MATWYVMCEAATAPSLESVLAALKPPTRARTALTDEGIVISVDGRDLHIRFERGTEVVADARHLAAEHAEGRVDRAAVARLDARFVLDFSLSDAADLFNLIAKTAEKLEMITRGVVFDTDAQRFV